MQIHTKYLTSLIFSMKIIIFDLLAFIFKNSVEISSKNVKLIIHVSIKQLKGTYLLVLFKVKLNKIEINF